MKPSEYDRFKSTFETAHGKQQRFPFSSLLSGQIDFQTIIDSLEYWQDNVNDNQALLKNIKQCLENEVDPERIENQTKIPEEYLRGLRELGCLSAKIPQQYGGLGVSQCSFSRILGNWK